ncbi:hypothetical protein LINPERHAP1_LOCUS7655 [Linum perenne]
MCSTICFLLMIRYSSGRPRYVRLRTLRTSWKGTALFQARQLIQRNRPSTSPRIRQTTKSSWWQTAFVSRLILLWENTLGCLLIGGTPRQRPSVIFWIDLLLGLNLGAAFCYLMQGERL